MGRERVEHSITIFTEGERIEGKISHMEGIRLSDFFNAPMHQEAPFVILLNARVTCRRTGEELARPPFAMIARSRIVLVMLPSPDNA